MFIESSNRGQQSGGGEARPQQGDSGNKREQHMQTAALPGSVAVQQQGERGRGSGVSLRAALVGAGEPGKAETVGSSARPEGGGEPHARDENCDIDTGALLSPRQETGGIIPQSRRCVHLQSLKWTG